STRGVKYSTRCPVSPAALDVANVLIFVLYLGSPPPPSKAGESFCSVEVDLDLFRFGFLGLRQCDSQDSILICCLDLFGFHRRRQGNAAAEGPERPLTAEALALTFLAFGFALTRNCQHVILQR